MSSPDLIQAVSPVEDALVSAISDAAIIAYNGFGRKNTPYVYRQSRCFHVSRIMVKELTSRDDIDQLAEDLGAVSSYIGTMRPEFDSIEYHSYGTFNKDGESYVFDGTWQQFLPLPSKDAERRIWRFPRSRTPAITIPKVLVGKPKDFVAVAKDYGLPEEYEHFWLARNTTLDLRS